MQTLTVDLILSAFHGRADYLGVLQGDRFVPAPVTNGKREQLLHDHVQGVQRVGIYNLLQGDVVRFALVGIGLCQEHVSFDQSIVDSAAILFQRSLLSVNVKSLREVSASGPCRQNIWVFLANAMPAVRIHRILSALLHDVEATLGRKIEHEVFPSLSGTGGELGPCVPLPLFPEDVKIGRSVFIDEAGGLIHPIFEENPAEAISELERILHVEEQSPEAGQAGGREDIAARLSAVASTLRSVDYTHEVTQRVDHLKDLGLSEADTERTVLDWIQTLPDPVPEEMVKAAIRLAYCNVRPLPENRSGSAGFSPMGVSELREILGATIKEDNANKVITFLAMLSAYTYRSQANVSFNAPSSCGKSYIATECAKLFPSDDVVEVGYCSPTAFFHDRGPYIKETNTIVVDLSRKVLLFLDQPHDQLLQHLRPMLSHDKEEILLKITDKSQKAGLRTKNVLLRGFPAVIFCTAGLKIDEQESTRFILLSPETSQEKIRLGISEKIRQESDPLAYADRLEAIPGRRELRERVKAIKAEQITEIRIESEDRVKALFFERAQTLKPRHQRDIGRVLGFIKAHALMNLWFREREGSIIVANEEDIEAGFSLWFSIAASQDLNLPPYIYQIFVDVILKLYDEKNGTRGELALQARQEEGLTRREIILKHYDVYRRPLSAWSLQQQIIPMLEGCGLITQELDPNDRRRTLVYPTRQLNISAGAKNI